MVDDQARIARAFKAFQDAARQKDSDPDAFESARMRYYFLTKGTDWLSQEKRRIAADKLDPVIAQYRDMYTSLDTEASVQKGYTDSIAAIRDKQQSLTDGTERQTSFLERMLSEKQQSKSVFDRYMELTGEPQAEVPVEQPALVAALAKTPASTVYVADVLLGFMVVGLVYLVVSRRRS